MHNIVQQINPRNILTGGFSGLTWAQLNTHLSESVECRVYAIDLRGHGETTTSVQEDEFDLSAGKLANDILEVTTKLLGNVLIFFQRRLSKTS